MICAVIAKWIWFMGLAAAFTCMPHEAIAQVSTSTYFSVFARTAQGMDWRPPPEQEELLRNFREAGFNTATVGVFPNPPYQGIQTLEEYQGAVARDVATLNQYAQRGFKMLLNGNDIARFPRSLQWCLQTSWARPALIGALEAVSAVPGVLFIDLIDEVDLVYGDTPTPTDGRWQSIGLPDDAFIRLFQILRAARSAPLGWNTNSVHWVRYPFADSASVEWDDPDTTPNQILGFYRIAVAQRNAFRAAHPNIPLTIFLGGTGPYYQKWSRGNTYNPTQDRLIAQGDVPANIPAQLWTAVILGYTGIRAYHYDWGLWRDQRTRAYLAGIYACTDNGLFRNPLDGSWERMLPAPAIHVALSAWDGAYLGTDSGILQASGENFQVLSNIGPINRRIRTLGVDIVPGKIFAGTDGGLFSKRPEEDWIPVPGIPAIPILSIQSRYNPMSPVGTYIGTSSGLYVLRGEGAQRLSGVPQVSVHALRSQGDSVLFIGTENGLYLLGLDDRTIPRDTIQHFLPGIPVYSFIEREDDGDIYGGTQQGYYLLRPYEGVIVRLGQGLPDGPISRLAYTGISGNIGRTYALTPNGLYVQEGSSIAPWTRNQSGPNNVRNLVFLSDGALQTGFSYDGIGADIWQAYARNLPIVAELEAKILTPVLRETHLREGLLSSVREGRDWKLLIAVNGSSIPAVIQPESLLGSPPVQPRLRLIRGAQVSEIPMQASLTLPSLTVLLLESGRLRTTNFSMSFIQGVRLDRQGVLHGLANQDMVLNVSPTGMDWNPPERLALVNLNNNTELASLTPRREAQQLRLNTRNFTPGTHRIALRGMNGNNIEFESPAIIIAFRFSPPARPQFRGPRTVTSDRLGVDSSEHSAVVLYHWSFSRIQGLSQATLLTASNSASSSSSDNEISLKALQLSPGLWRASVAAEDASGNQSSATQGEVVLLAGDLSNVSIYPNPWRSDKHSSFPLRFEQLTPNAVVKIYTVSGQWVKTLNAPNGSASWDLNNDSGEKVASGLYLFLISDDQGNKTSGKLAIIK